MFHASRSYTSSSTFASRTWRRALAVLLASLTTFALHGWPEVGPAAATPDRTARGEGVVDRAAATAGLFADRAPRKVRLERSRRPVELGLRFRSSAAGTVTGAQVYKLAKGRGATPRRASVWTGSGKRLATARFERRRGAGWIQVRFSAPVAVEPGRTYVVSVFAPRGRYAVTERGLRKGRTRGVLSSAGGRNGVYRYGGTSRFPTRSHRSSNYWVDVLFRRGDTTTTTTTSTGFPDATNTGVPAGTELTPYTGPSTITTPGTVIDAKQITGGLEIRATDVTITRSSVTGNVSVTESGSLTISDTFIDAGDVGGTGLEAYNYTATRVHVIGGNRSMYCASDCTIRDSYVHGQMTDESGTFHESGIRMEQNTRIIHNTIACDAPDVPPDAGCSAGLTGYGDFAPVQNNLIENNFFMPSTGGTCAYGGSSGGKPFSDGARDIRFIDNVFARGETGKCGFYAPIMDFDASAPGNVWQNNVWENGGQVRP